jgi:hypothetical protein
MKHFLFLFFTFSFLVTCNSQVESAQKDTTLRLIEKHDGTRYIAKILSDDGRELLLETEALGKLYLPKSEVKRISIIEDVGELKDGEFMEDSPFTTRYAFTNNALPIEKGNDYAMLNLFGPEIHFAVSNRLNLGVMTTWIGSPLAIVGKFTIPTLNDKINFSLSTIFGTIGYLNNFRNFGGLHWGTLTIGDRRNNASFSGGVGYYDGEVRPIISFAGIFKVSGKSSFFYDSMIAFNQSSATFYLMPGMRFQTSEKKAFQFALAGVSIDGDWIPLPLVSWFRKF